MKLARYANRYGRRARRGARGGAAVSVTVASIFGADNVEGHYLADLANVTQVGNAVSGLADSSGNGYHLNQASGTNLMTWDATGWNGNRGCIISDRGAGAATRKWLSADGGALANLADGESPVYAAVFTMQLVTQGATDTLLSFGNSGSATDIRACGLHDGSTRWGGFERGGAASVNLDSGDASDTNRHTYALARRAGELVDVYLDGAPVLTGASMAALAAIDFNRFTVGAFRRSSVAEGSNAKFREVVVISGAVTAQQLADYHAFAQEEHGI